MKFKIAKRLFYNGLNSVSRAISANSPIPALSGIKIEAAENELILTASDSNVSIRKICLPLEDQELSIIETGSVVIDSRYILELVRKMDTDVIQVELLDGALTRFTGKSVEFTINGIVAQNYPDIDFSPADHEFAIPSSTLLTMINQTVFATSTQETRPALTGVNFNAAGEVLELVATDSYRLAKKTVQLAEPANFNITIPGRSLQEVVKTIDGEESVRINVSQKKVQFYLNHTLIQSRLIDGSYPETSRLIPLEFAYEFEVNAADFLNAIDRASFIKSDGVSIVRLSASEQALVLSSRSQEVGSSEEKITPVNYRGGALEISFSGKYVYEAIKAVNANTIFIQFSGQMKPFIIHNKDDESILQLILPVRTYY